MPLLALAVILRPKCDSDWRILCDPKHCVISPPPEMTCKEVGGRAGTGTEALRRVSLRMPWHRCRN